VLTAVSKGGLVTVRETPRPVPGPGDVIVKIQAVGVCETDVHMTLNPGDPLRERVMGHEWSGVLESTARDLEAGARVIGEGMVGCGLCPMCKEGRANLCDSYEEIGFSLPGAYAEYLSVPAANIHGLPREMSFEEGAMVEPTAVACHALELSGMEEGDTVAVLGPGPIGLLALQVARARGAGYIALTGTRESRLELGRALGADMTVNVESEEVVRAIRDEIEGGPDVVLDAAGTASSFDQATRVAAKGGSIVLVGAWDRVTWSPGIAIVKELQIRGSLASPGAWPLAIDLIRRGKVDVEPLITHRFPLAEITRAFDLVDRRVDGVVKAVILP